MSTSFHLEKYNGIKSRHTCPSCGKSRQFTRYIDDHTGEYVADHVGICNRSNKCGYHYPPSAYFAHTPSEMRKTPAPAKRFTVKQHAVNTKSTPDFIPMEQVEKTLTAAHYANNNLVTFMREQFGNALTLKACKQFKLGTSKHWPGATIFWQIDADGNVRTGKIMLYDPQSGKRVKHPYNHVTWAHTKMLPASNVGQQSYNLMQCLFGLHQIVDANSRTVIIVESEKTAMIASIYLPQYTWMACGGLKNLNANTLQPIKHCSIILYPDINAYSEWEAKASALRNQDFRIQVSTLLEKLSDHANQELIGGLDLADFLLRQPPKKSPLEHMMDKNPHLVVMVERLGLIESGYY